MDTFTGLVEFYTVEFIEESTLQNISTRDVKNYQNL